ncbi:DMT family transporter [methanotrophic endosymbiont of Bathymodiolus puteoserpentis (Logatchev)]|jgi:drug/metabolite transporter (DMT)-like permease|uniref:DMT family transporter n=1 Tax=methanotrophic endosymbiont of Bathymodiolus puteoserpentis (Logatchev) TaxID=343235 RepID=UPI0013CA6D1F|nr:DMT family transporter [methanotrophic endosymbiont of Bathymodiolus puteoserpentis (Logatchev)]SHE22638.1 Permease of the drug/metabolite transporter (DMT) superfamily [methanotrophic endosymbiont of Bathymodiolus puteoserpentis (Logatchev)]
MRIALAFIFIVLLWSTTPLAIKWSAEGSSFIFGVAARMVIGLICILFMLLLSRQPLPWHSKARQTYFAIAVQVYGAMMAVYWGAQFIPSGWVSVIFGLSPFITALLTALWLEERSLTWDKLLAYLLGVGGLALIFSTAIQMSFQSVLGILSVLLAVFLQALSAVWVKRLQAKLPALTQVTGGLIFATPLYLLTWWIIDGVIPTTLPAHSLLSILYLGIIATPIGFALYYYVLTHLAATHVALITLVSPVFALFLGYYLNEEMLTIKIIAGTGLILCALLIHSFVGRYYRKAG